MNEINIPEELLKSKIVVVDFFATWCGPCKALSPIIDELTEEYKNDSDVTFIKIDVDNNIELAKTLNVKSIPNVVFIKDNLLADRFAGFKGNDEIKNIISKLKLS